VRSIGKIVTQCQDTRLSAVDREQDRDRLGRANGVSQILRTFHIDFDMNGGMIHIGRLFEANNGRAGYQTLGERGRELLRGGGG
jgi:hypothetical protein